MFQGALETNHEILAAGESGPAEARAGSFD